MRIPISWLKDYVDIVLPIDELAHRLTMAGLEVASIEYIGLPAPDKPSGLQAPFAGSSEGRSSPHLIWERDKIFVGQIVEVRPHPNADRLTIAVVDFGAKEPLAVVTGAPNIRAGESGQKVPFATVGARLIDGHGDGTQTLTLKPTKIRGVVSEGMICSEKELGLSDNHEVILILDDDAPVGMPLADYLGDVVFEIDITPNMARCLSMIGVAREIAALTGQKLRPSPTTMTATGPSIEGQVAIEIADSDLCPRYSATLIRDVKIGPSPRWMQRRLTLAGMRPINNVVDITNYVMLEWGQPLHAFDYDKLRSRSSGQPPRIIVRRAKIGEWLITLDGVDRELSEDMLLITDMAGPIAVAGVMGGADTEVGDSTTNVLLESANFDFINNRRTAQALKLPSEATARFGRGVDPEGTVPAAQRASELMRQLAGGTIAQGVADAYVRRLETKRIVLTVGDDAPAPNSVPRPSMGAGASEVKRILGMDVSAEQIKAILESLEFRVGGDKAGRLIVTVPSYRLDVSIPADLIEDIARLIGYDQIPTTLMSDVLPPQRRNRALEGEERVRDILVGCGLQEVITYSLTTPEAEAKLSTEFGSAPYIRLANPISSDRVVMRRTLQSSLLENLALNLKHHDRVLIFEIGRVYLSELGDGALPAEPRRLAIAMTGPRDPRSWRAESRRELDFFDLKGVVEALLTHLHLEVASFEPIEHPIFHPGRAARLKVNSCHDAPAPTNAPRPSMGAGTSEIGILGELHPQVVERFDLGARRVSLAELDLDALLVAAERPRFYEPLSRFPAVQQDIALIVDDDVPAVRVRDLIAEAGGKLLRHVELFDLYRGQPIPAGKKSLAYSLTFQADDRTLTDDEVARLYQRIVRRVNEAIGAELRGNQ